MILFEFQLGWVIINKFSSNRESRSRWTSTQDQDNVMNIEQDCKLMNELSKVHETLR